MTAFSDWHEDNILNWFRGTTFPAATGSVYVALFTAAPSDSGGGTEVSGNAYARQAITKAAGSWAAPAGSPRAITNAAEVTFPTATPAGWGTVTHVGMHDALTVGNLIYHGALDTSKAVGIGDVVRFAIGALSLRAD